MPALSRRDWVPPACGDLVQSTAATTASADAAALDAEIDRLAAQSRAIHEHDCINLNPAGNALNPRAEAAAGRWRSGYAGQTF